MGGIDWKKWQDDQDKRNGPNAKNPRPVSSPPREAVSKKKKKVLTAHELKPELSPDFPDSDND